MEIPPLDRDSPITLSRQLLEWFRAAASDGSLPAGEELPATRALARELGVSRNTVCEAYDLLVAEGYIECGTGRRARVAGGLALQGAPPGASGGASVAPPRLPPIETDLRTGLPDPGSLPKKAWARALLLAAENAEPGDWLYGPAAGHPALRAEIASYLFRNRGMRVAADRVFVTAGATHALHILATVMARSGRPAAVEDPCHLGLLRTFKLAGLPVVSVEADESGMKTGNLAGVDAGLAYVTPSHHFPLGGILGADRRAQLIRWARDREAWIAEDDYDSEFRYSGPPVAPLWTMDADRTVYVGTFSKTFFPALRIGFAVVPPALEKEWKEARVHADVQNPVFEQLALARLLADRTIDRHVAKMRRLYARRRAALLAALSASFGDGIRVLGDASGLHVAVRFAGVRFDRDLVGRARERGIRLVSAERHSVAGGAWQDTLLLGYGHLDEARLATGVGRIAAFLSGGRAP